MKFQNLRSLQTYPAIIGTFKAGPEEDERVVWCWFWCHCFVEVCFESGCGVCELLWWGVCGCGCEGRSGGGLRIVGVVVGVGCECGSEVCVVEFGGECEGW